MNSGNKWKSYFLSYLFAFLSLVLFLFFGTSVFVANRETPSIFFPFINAAALNTIIIIIINSLINRSKNEKAERELNILKIKNLEAEQQLLIQQLQPHFLFNALSTLKALINSNTEQAEEYLVKLSDFLRFSVSSHNFKVTLLEKEVAFMRDYIRLQQIRFGDSFFYEIHIPEDVLQSFVVPVYALQTLVENAIKHNAFTSVKPLYLSITFKDGYIHIKNNKIPKHHENKNGVGLENLNRRFLLNGVEQIKIDNRNDSFLVTIKLIRNK